ncbi:E3 ubiquitin ligase TRAF3IP2-like isoform X2 [Conger conger]|uniref:E3 ubiquitin ligase TRAF3IP2-like isoform X2 n=1 Tax=Conger conger TaxID=82655 RepID=UPI002A59B404|nr:E3 ubiquitin ligase TRAF3IP2-like isoform X2 [Conger conger]
MPPSPAGPTAAPVAHTSTKEPGRPPATGAASTQVGVTPPACLSALPPRSTPAVPLGRTGTPTANLTPAAKAMAAWSSRSLCALWRPLQERTSTTWAPTTPALTPPRALPAVTRARPRGSGWDTRPTIVPGQGTTGLMDTLVQTTVGVKVQAPHTGKVFVTYEADCEKHVNEIIKFVALLRHNGFDTHIDVFEQQFISISKIDFMEKFINEKDYLIIIAISPKYHKTVTGTLVSMENDERTLNTVYIHKQLQNEFIQNGCRNFRFIPILFPGAKKCHVPTWLQNTHVYSWPKNRDDILRRLMRVEKYNPPPIGELPTIVSIPL